MPLTVDLLMGIVFYGLIGYVGGWLFKADSHLRDKRGILVAFFITYVVFFMVIFAGVQISNMQNWWITGAYSLAFIYRFFLHRG